MWKGNEKGDRLLDKKSCLSPLSVKSCLSPYFFSGGFIDSYKAICSALESFLPHPFFPLHILQRSSEHHWQKLQSAQGCFLLFS